MYIPYYNKEKGAELLADIDRSLGQCRVFHRGFGNELQQLFCGFQFTISSFIVPSIVYLIVYCNVSSIVHCFM